MWSQNTGPALQVANVMVFKIFVSRQTFFFRNFETEVACCDTDSCDNKDFLPGGFPVEEEGEEEAKSGCSPV